MAQIHGLSLLETSWDCTGADPDPKQIGGSLSFGPGGAKFTVGSRGKQATSGLR
ncbi:MAG: hypothetical protein KAU38_17020 [Desulfobacterales bacterium]|nr:hypothetical protein [Desulfobacterales bacterium]